MAIWIGMTLLVVFMFLPGGFFHEEKKRRKARELQEKLEFINRNRHLYERKDK